MDSGADLTVADDRFFAEVRRRHPDIDIVLLPQELASDDSTTPMELGGLADVSARFESELDSLWLEIAPGIVRPTIVSHWKPGSRTGSVVREALLAVEPLDAVRGLTSLSAAARALTAADWHVLVPPTGLPRVLAGREDGAEVLLVHVEARDRFAVTFRSTSYDVGAAVAAGLVAGEL